MNVRAIERRLAALAITRRELMMTLTETLLANGYTHSRVGCGGAHEIYYGRKRVFVGTSPEVWGWLRMLSVMAGG